jgi:hypothetical protein
MPRHSLGFVPLDRRLFEDDVGRQHARAPSRMRVPPVDESRQIERRSTTFSSGSRGRLSPVPTRTSTACRAPAVERLGAPDAACTRSREQVVSRSAVYGGGASPNLSAVAVGRTRRPGGVGRRCAPGLHVPPSGAAGAHRHFFLPRPVGVTALSGAREEERAPSAAALSPAYAVTSTPPPATSASRASSTTAWTLRRIATSR